MRNIKLDNDSYTLQSKWSELTPKQVIDLAKIYLAGNGFIRLKVVYCLYLMGLRLKYSNPVMLDGKSLYYVKYNRKRVYLLSLEQIYSIVSCIEWIFYTEKTADGPKISINPRLIFNPAKQIKVYFTKLQGPDDGLGNISFMEFIHAETFLFRYNSTADPKWLAMFIATLWRPVKNGKLTEFDQSKVDRWAKRTAKIKPEVSLALTWYYQGCKFFLSNKFKRVFSGVGGKATDPFEGFLNLTSTLAGADVTKMERVRASSLYDTLTALEQMLQAQEEQQKKNKQR